MGKIINSIIFIIIAVICLSVSIDNFKDYNLHRDDEFVNTVGAPIPMTDLPLVVTKDFDLYYDSDKKVHSFLGSIKNTSNKTILIDELRFTYKYGGTIYKYDLIEANIIIQPFSTYNYAYTPGIIPFYNWAKQNYQYILITINDKEEYLYHENYQSVIKEYNQKVKKAEKNFEDEKIKYHISAIIFLIIFIILILISTFLMIKGIVFVRDMKILEED